jgi:hypothetical protein
MIDVILGVREQEPCVFLDLRMESWIETVGPATRSIDK